MIILKFLVFFFFNSIVFIDAALAITCLHDDLSIYGLLLAKIYETANDCDPHYMRLSLPRLKPMQNSLILQGLELIKQLELVPPVSTL